MPEVYFRKICIDVRVLSNRTQFDDSLRFAFHLQNHCSHSHRSFSWCKIHLELTVGVGEEDSFGGTDSELCELEEVGERLGIGIEDGEGLFSPPSDRAEAEFIAVGDGKFDGFFVF